MQYSSERYYNAVEMRDKFIKNFKPELGNKYHLLIIKKLEDIEKLFTACSEFKTKEKKLESLSMAEVKIKHCYSLSPIQYD